MQFLLAAALALACAPAFADCVTLEKVQKKEPGATMTPLSDAEFHFLQGIYALNPATPPGLPPGAGAMLMKEKGKKGGLVFWVSGTLVCDPMNIPNEILEMLHEVKAGKGSL
jgi:hypothetical protein